MSNRVEWANASAVIFELLPRGTDVHGYDEPVTEDWGLYLELGGSGVIIEGSAEELDEFAGRLTALIIRGTTEGK